jgi:hypothetical protein
MGGISLKIFKFEFLSYEGEFADAIAEELFIELSLGF